MYCSSTTTCLYSTRQKIHCKTCSRGQVGAASFVPASLAVLFGRFSGTGFISAATMRPYTSRNSTPNILCTDFPLQAVLFCPALYCVVQFNCAVAAYQPVCAVLYCTLLYCTIQYSTVQATDSCSRPPAPCRPSAVFTSAEALPDWAARLPLPLPRQLQRPAG